MQTEIEAKFLDVDHDVLRAKLREIGAVCEQPMREMSRKGFDFPDGRLRKDQNGWVRVRDEGNKITMSYKQLNDRTLVGTKEVCLTIDSFEQAEAFLKALGMVQGTYQVTKRESWRLGHIEIELDEWPWAKPYVEMEARDEAELRDIATKLDLDWGQVKHGSVEVVYTAEYDVTDADVNSWPEITFTPVPEWLEAKRKAVA
jgi:adenylate cyclase class 2